MNNLQEIQPVDNTIETLRVKQERYKSLTEASMDGFLVVDIEGRILEVNDAYCMISGYSRDTLLSMHVSDLEQAETKEEVKAHIEKIINQGRDQFESRHYKADGTVFNVYNRLTFMPIEKVIICFLHDITERKKQEAKLEYIGYHDILTGLYNRTYFEEEIKRLDVDRQLPLSILMGDINGLKLINDSFGHETGDQTIIEMANIIKSCCREEDIVARVGGDEFCILLPNSDDETVRRISNRIHNKSEQNKKNVKSGISFISISLGYSCRTILHEPIEVLIKEAEVLMYRHKLLETKSLRSSIVSSIVSTLKERYIETDEHSERMKRFSRDIGIALGLSDSMLDDLELLAILHDIGKISIRDTIINKNGKLTKEEKEEMKRHSEIGYSITQSTIEFQQISEYILAHHEKWDGSGYPQKIKGEGIPLLSRIISVVDAYDAMTNNKPYRRALSQEDAMNEIKKCSGTQFDPKIARIFIEKVVGGKW